MQALDASDSTHHVILLHDPNDLKYRALYTYDFNTDVGEKIGGRGHASLKSGKICAFYRYNSGIRRFTPVQTAEMNAMVDAVCLATSKKHKPILRTS